MSAFWFQYLGIRKIFPDPQPTPQPLGFSFLVRIWALVWWCQKMLISLTLILRLTSPSTSTSTTTTTTKYIHYCAEMIPNPKLSELVHRKLGIGILDSVFWCQKYHSWSATCTSTFRSQPFWCQNILPSQLQPPPKPLHIVLVPNVNHYCRHSFQYILLSLKLQSSSSKLTIIL